MNTLKHYTDGHIAFFEMIDPSSPEYDLDSGSYVCIPEKGKWWYAALSLPNDGWKLFRIRPMTFDEHGIAENSRYRVMYDDAAYDEQLRRDRERIAGEKLKMDDWLKNVSDALRGSGGYTVAECRSQLQKHHPDRGGDPADFDMWKGRLDAARARA